VTDSDGGRLIVVGLGPAGPDLVTSGTLAAIARSTRRFARTTRHPAVDVLGDCQSFDELYEAADHLDQVYDGIVERLAAECASAGASGNGPVLYAVPGSPLVAERSVRQLLADERLDVTVVPALSFLDLLWTRLGVDPLEHGVSVVDGHRFTIDAAGLTGPMVVCQCDSALVLSDIKLAVDEWPDEPITVVQRLGLPDELIVEVAWQDLDRVVDADHLTSLWIPSLHAPVAQELVRFDELVHALREGCPWDREQTHASLRRYLLEETYELLEAIDSLGPVDGDAEPAVDAIDDLAEELGDVLFQVFFHATIAAESGWFTLADVASGVHDKLRDRHPHVFGTATFESSDELARSWEAAKVAEKGRDSVFDGIPAALPALLFALKAQKKAAAIDVVIEPDLAQSARSLVDDPTESSLASVLWDVVAVARDAGLDPEAVLRSATRRFADRHA